MPTISYTEWRNVFDEHADDWDSDESGTIWRIGSLLFLDTVDGPEIRKFSTPELAAAELESYRSDGFGADEDDAYISYERSGVSVSFAGKYVGTYETERRAKAKVSLLMREQGFFPDVWLCGEHGPTIRNISDQVW